MCVCYSFLFKVLRKRLTAIIIFISGHPQSTRDCTEPQHAGLFECITWPIISQNRFFFDQLDGEPNSHRKTFFCLDAKETKNHGCTVIWAHKGITLKPRERNELAPHTTPGSNIFLSRGFISIVKSAQIPLRPIKATVASSRV